MGYEPIGGELLKINNKIILEWYNANLKAAIL